MILLHGSAGVQAGNAHGARELNDLGIATLTVDSCDVIRHSLLKVSRVRLGGLSFEGLKMGDWRDLTKAEIADLRKRAGFEN